MSQPEKNFPKGSTQARPSSAPTVLAGPPALLGRLPTVTARHAEVATLHEAIRGMSDRVHLLTPTAQPGFVPEFHEVMIRLVVVDPREESGEVYKLPGARDDERALTKVALDRIAAAAGISWDPLRSGRLDDGSDPNYVHFRSVGYVRDLDGSRRTLVGEKEVDLRDGNPSIFTDDPEKMAHRYDQERRRYTNEVDNPGFVKGWSHRRLAEARQQILSMAESKAKNRLVRSLGVKQKYRVAELAEKPFAVLSLVLTGRSEDPEMQRMARTRMLEAALATSREIYGAEQPVERRLRALPEPAPPALEERHPPPPLGAAVKDDDGLVPGDEIVCACPEGPSGLHEAGCEFQGVSDAR